MEMQRQPPLTAFGKFRWAMKEGREYIATVGTMIITLQVTGILDRVWPEEGDGMAPIAAAIPAEAVTDDLDSFGRVVIDPEALELAPFEPTVDIGTAIVLECPFEEGCVEAAAPEATMPPLEAMPIPGVPPLAFTGGPQETAVPYEIEFVPPAESDFIGDNGLLALALFVTLTIAGTTIFKRWRGRRRAR